MSTYCQGIIPIPDMHANCARGSRPTRSDSEQASLFAGEVS